MSGSRGWRPHEWVRVLIKGLQAAPSPSTMQGRREKTPSVNRGAQTCRPLDPGLPAFQNDEEHISVVFQLRSA